MSDILNRFNWLASRYDFLARLVFGEVIYNSQVHFLRALPPDGSILILGGGSGEILTWLMEIKPDSRIWFIEASSEMLKIADKRIPGKEKHRIHFIHGTEEITPKEIEFDAVICNFFLDLFPDSVVLAICQRVYRKLKSRGLWIVSDFVDTGKWRHRFMLWIMYWFFVVTCRIEACRLPRWESQLLSIGMGEKGSQTFYGGFVKSVLYQKEK